MRQRGWVIDPSKSRWVQRWDLGMLVPLLFTVIFTPVEICFMTEGAHLTVLFLINRLVDAIFVVDMVFQFCLMYRVGRDEGGGTAWEYRPRWIALHYVDVVHHLLVHAA